MSNALLSSKLEELSQCKEVELFCIKLIYEFLLCNNFKKTIAAFTEEVLSSPYSLPTELPHQKDRIEKDDVLKIISAMEMEDHLQFFERWTKLVPMSMKEIPDYKNITLPLYTFFATLPVRKEKQCPSGETTASYEDKLDSKGSTNRVDEKYKKISHLSQLEGESLNSTFTLDKPTVTENIVEVGSASERELDIEPDSLDEVSDTEGKRKKRGKILPQPVKEDVEEDTIFIYDEDTQENIKFTEKPVNNSIRDIDQAGKGKSGKTFDTSLFKKEEEKLSLIKKECDTSEPSAMALFQNFLLEKRYSFDTAPQNLPLFALPFIQNPEEHEAFNQLFQDKWVRDLKESLLNFLIKFSCGDDVVPEIVKICKENKLYQSQLKNKSDINEDYSKLYKESRRKLHKLKRDHKNLVGIASELASALENSVRGEAVDLKTTLYQCTKIFPELFPNAQILDSQSFNGDGLGKVDKDKAWIGLSHLDTKKIKEDVMNGNIKTKLLLLQAIRWGVCEADVEERERIVSWLGREDGLGLETEDGIGRGWLGCREAHPLQQALARLLNCIASLRTGRDYIAGAKPPLVPLIAASLARASHQDRLTQDMLLALLQKLSLRKGMCDEMMKEGLLEWLSTRLGGSQSLYQLEYATSLFMNLSIHTPISYWDTRPHQVLPALISLLNTDNEQVLEFILGSLYCLLRSDKLNIFARSVGLTNQLNGVSSERCKRLVVELLRLHRRELPLSNLRLPPPMLSEEDIEDPDEMEGEVNADDPVKGSPSGNEFLAQHYRLIFPTPGIVGHASGDRMKLRPTTPRAHHSLPAWAL